VAAHDEPGKKVVTWQLRERFAAGEGGDDSGYSMGWLAGAIGRRIDDPYALYEALSQEAPA
jgi:uncharacterized glyoxalase superfamily metalloenzyme YdcJ